MKIAILTNHMKGDDGWSRYSKDLVEEFKRFGHKVLVLTEAGDRPLLKRPLAYLANPFVARRTAKRIYPILKEFEPDVIHIMAEPYAAILTHLPRMGARRVLTIHGTYSWIPGLFGRRSLRGIISQLMAIFYFRKLDALVSVSHYTLEHLKKEKRFVRLPVQTCVISNGISASRLAARYARVPSDKKKVLFVGAVKDRKGVLEGVKHFEYYLNNFSQSGPVSLDIVGSIGTNDPYASNIRSYIDQRGLASAVTLRGRVSEDELARAYEDADLFMMLSKKSGKRFEGFGLVYLEANAHGIPVIGAYGSGAEDAIADGLSGFLVDPNDPKNGAEKIHALLSDRVLYERCSAGALGWAKEHTWDKIVERYLEVYTT